jgi:PhnB protein
MPTSPPPGYHSVTAYLVVSDARTAIDFYKRAFNAEEVMLLSANDGKVVHAEIKIGDSPIMLADEWPEWGALSPQTLGGSATSLMLYVEDCDSVFEQAVNAGAEVVMPVADQFYGDRSGQVTDPFGHKWSISTNIETLTEEEITQRMAAWEKENV